MKAQLKKDIVVWGADIPTPRYQPTTEQGRAAQEIFTEAEAKFDDKYRASARKYSLPRQEVEVVQIFDQADIADQYATPTPPGLAASVRGTNFDGEQVETTLALSDLEGIPDDPDRVMKLVKGAIEWNQIRRLFGLT